MGIHLCLKSGQLRLSGFGLRLGGKLGLLSGVTVQEPGGCPDGLNGHHHIPTEEGQNDQENGFGNHGWNEEADGYRHQCRGDDRQHRKDHQHLVKTASLHPKPRHPATRHRSSLAGVVEHREPGHADEDSRESVRLEAASIDEGIHDHDRHHEQHGEKTEGQGTPHLGRGVGYRSSEDLASRESLEGGLITVRERLGVPVFDIHPVDNLVTSARNREPSHKVRRAAHSRT